MQLLESNVDNYGRRNSKLNSKQQKLVDDVDIEGIMEECNMRFGNDKRKVKLSIFSYGKTIGTLQKLRENIGMAGNCYRRKI